MPWLRKIHLVTWGHLPKWLNLHHPKLSVVKHTDFIPKEYLPTFNSHTIELNLHRIPDLAEQFIYFNDDMFPIGSSSEEDFFRGGLPCDMAALRPYTVVLSGIASIVINNLEVINTHFSKQDIYKNRWKWYSVKYGKFNFSTFYMLLMSSINGIYEPHSAISFRKSIFEEVWEKEYEVLHSTCQSRFREKHNVNVWLMRDWQLLTGRFIIRRSSFSKYRTLPEHEKDILSILKKPERYKIICINDSVRLKEYEEMKGRLNKVLEERFPVKCKFEL